MRVFVYVDGFNLYYRALKNTPFKWLDVRALAMRLLRQDDEVEKVRYFTARISPRHDDPDAPGRQQIYIKALNTIPQIEFHWGSFLTKKKYRPLVRTNEFVYIRDTEEKGSDVNFATHLLNDGWKNEYDLALVLSQDSDLIEPIRIVTEELNKNVGLIWLDGKAANVNMSRVASFTRHVRQSDLRESQFPNPIFVDGAPPIVKPREWE